MSDASWGIGGDIRNQCSACSGMSSSDDIYAARRRPVEDASTFEMYTAMQKARDSSSRMKKVLLIIAVVLFVLFAYLLYKQSRSSYSYY